MKKLILSLAAAVILALLGFLGWKMLSPDHPRERLSSKADGDVLVEELSYYLHGQKAFGKVYKPCDENGRFPDSLGTRPVVIFFHEPLKTALAAKTAQGLAGRGVITYAVACDGTAKSAKGLAGKIRGEKFTDPDLLFLVADAFNGNAVIDAALQLKGKVAGAVLIEPDPDEKTARKVTRLPYKAVSVGTEEKGNLLPILCAYLEENGAMK